MSNLQINTRVRRLFHYLEDFERGIIRVPAFQRDFEWDNKKKIKLFDSIKEGYPIGSILFWRPDFTNLDDFKNFEADKIGSYFLPERATDYFYILDGYQRLSTLFGCLVNPNKTNLKRDEKDWELNFNLIYNLESNKIEVLRKANHKIHEVPLYEFVDGGEFLEFQTELLRLNIDKAKVDLYRERYKAFNKKLSSYDIPSIDMIGGKIEEAVDIFTRLNSEGAKITADWKLSALSFNKLENFRLGTEIDNLLEKLSLYNFNGLSRKLIFQCITNAFGNVFFDQKTNDTQNLNSLVKEPKFIEITRQTIINIQKAVKFLFEELLVLNSKLLPYNNQLIFITDFFNKIESPSTSQLEKLKKWFWITTYSNYFTIYNLSQQRLAYNAFQQFIINEESNPIYYDRKYEKFETLSFPNKIEMGSVRAKALALFMLQYQLGNKKLDADNASGYETCKIFNNFEENKKETNISENTILVIKSDTPLHMKKNKKNVSEWLFLEDNLDKYFITKEMRNLHMHKKESNKKFLEMRKKLIIEVEKAFVEDLGLKYI